MNKVGRKERAANFALALEKCQNKFISRSLDKIKDYTEKIGAAEQAVFEKRFDTLTKKAFLMWHASYFKKIRREYDHYSKSLVTKTLLGFMTSVAATKLKKEKAQHKVHSNLMFKVWLSFLKHVNECREEKQEDEERLRDYRERTGFTGVEIRPCIDKILPEDLELDGNTREMSRQLKENFNGSNILDESDNIQQYTSLRNAVGT